MKCELCETEEATVKITATDLDGVVLDQKRVCKGCAADAGLEVGLVYIDVPKEAS